MMNSAISPAIKEYDEFWSNFKEGDSCLVCGLPAVFRGWYEDGETGAKDPLFDLSLSIRVRLLNYEYSDIVRYDY